MWLGWGSTNETADKILEVSPIKFANGVQGTRETRTKDHDEVLAKATATM